MTIRFWVGVATEMSFGMGAHKTLKPPVFPGNPTPSVEVPSTHLTGPGLVCGANKLAFSVLAGRTSFPLGGTDMRAAVLEALGASAFVQRMERAVAQDGTDGGIMIMDLTPAALADNLAYPLVWPFSSRKAMFSSSIVKVEGKPVAAMDFVFMLLSCGDPTKLPVPGLTLPKPVSAGMVPTDVALGLGRIVADIAIDFLFARLLRSSSSSANLPSGLTLAYFLDTFTGELFKKLFAPRNILKYALKSLVGFMLEDACGRDPTFKLKVGPSSANYEVRVGEDYTSVRVQLGPGSFELGGPL